MGYRSRRYDSFLVKRWCFDQSFQRVIVEHLQSGYRTSFDTLGEAMTWMEAAGGESGGAGTADNQAETSKHDQEEVSRKDLGRANEITPRSPQVDSGQSTD